jgi:hypothetical protein
VCIEQEERQEGEKNLFSRNPSDLSLTKSQKCKECVGNQNPLRIKLRRDNTFHKCRRDPIDGLEGGAKVEAFEYLENLLSQKRSELLEVDPGRPFRSIVKIMRSTVTSHCRDRRCSSFTKLRVGRNPNHSFGERTCVGSR